MVVTLADKGGKGRVGRWEEEGGEERLGGRQERNEGGMRD